MGQAKPGSMSTAAPMASGKCPICRGATTHDTRPFCSKKCADLDLMRWMRGSYVIEGASQDDDEDGDGADAPPEIAPRLPREEEE